MRLLLTPLAFLFSLNLLAQGTVEVCGAEPNKGQILLAVYNTKETFGKEDKVYKSYIIPVNNKGCAVKQLKDLPNGTYALAAAYDKNSNGEFDKNFMGIPKEPYGFSNDARASLSIPKYEDALVKVSDNEVIRFKVDL
ncbi:MAG: DUF2141 domain-containing protein [Luteibaculaceae bacterium]